MADKNGDWTGGILAIAAAVMIGFGVPAGLYYSWYQSLVDKNRQLVAKKSEIAVGMELQLGKESKVTKLDDDADLVEEKLAKLESRFVVEPRIAIDAIYEFANQNHLKKLPNYEDDVQKVELGPTTVEWENGLRASQILIEVTGTYHDFGRFVAEVESMDSAVVIADKLIVTGDSSRGSIHRFSWSIYVVEQRTEEVAPVKGP